MPTVGIWALSILGVQMLFGAYVAGLDAGYAFNTWPMMGSEWFPADTPMLEPFLRNYVDNPIVVQFIHRWVAFAVAVMVLLLAFEAWSRNLRSEAVAVVAAVFVQILIGILTLLTGVDLWIAVAHQGMAAILLGTIVLAAHRIGARPA
jgi:cytochrome c oxidase assembly protein subunit 15